ncbi:MAG: HD domain-containing protein [Candidatus Edwardsbacteria bacterium]
MGDRKILLAKGDLSRDQTWDAHSYTTKEIANIIAELRRFGSENKELLLLSAQFHDIGKKFTECFKGQHKLDFETCFGELKKEFPGLTDEKAKIVSHIILRHHYTSDKDIEELTKIWTLPSINIDMILRYLRASDRIASIDYLNMAELDEIAKLVKPLNIFAYTISREGILAGKIMDIVDDQITGLSGRGIYYHNGSIFLLPEGMDSVDIESFREQLRKSIALVVDEICSDLIGIQNNPRQVIVSPISELNSSVFPLLWKRLLQRFDTKLRSKRERTREGAHLWIQKAISEIFVYLESIQREKEGLKGHQKKQKNKPVTYQTIIKKPSQKIYNASEILAPIIRKLPHSIYNKRFDGLSYAELEKIGETLYSHIREVENNYPELFKTGLRQSVVDQTLNILTFWGESPKNISEVAEAHYQRYVEIAKRKAIGQRGIEEYCFLCGEPAEFTFESAIAQKVKFAKIFSNRRPALARNISNIKLCNLCLTEIKFLDSKLPSDISNTVFLYIEKPATTKPPYWEIEQAFTSRITILELNESTILTSKEWQDYIGYVNNLFTDEEKFNLRYAIGTNHFYTIFGWSPPKRFSQRELIILLLPFFYQLIRQVNCSVRIDLAQNMEFTPLYYLLEIPPIAQNFTAEDFTIPTGKFYRKYLLPSEAWRKLQMGNIIEFVKKFPDNWIHYASRTVQEENRGGCSYLNNKFSVLKEVYPMKEPEILKAAIAVSEKLRRRGYSRYAITRPVQMISDSILRVKREGFEDEAIIDYAVNRVLTLSSKEIGREIKKGEDPVEQIKAEIFSEVERLTRLMFIYLKENGFKKFILLVRYLTDAVLVETKFS